MKPGLYTHFMIDGDDDKRLELIEGNEGAAVADRLKRIQAEGWVITSAFYGIYNVKHSQSGKTGTVGVSVYRD